MHQTAVSASIPAHLLAVLPAGRLQVNAPGSFQCAVYFNGISLIMEVFIAVYIAINAGLVRVKGQRLIPPLLPRRSGRALAMPCSHRGMRRCPFTRTRPAFMAMYTAIKTSIYGTDPVFSRKYVRIPDIADAPVIPELQLPAFYRLILLYNEILLCAETPT